MKRFQCGVVFLLIMCLFGCAHDNVAPATTNKVVLIPEEDLVTEFIPLTTEYVPTTETETTSPEPNDDDFVLVTDFIPNISVELRYATNNNFTGKVIYEFNTLYLRYGTVKKLILVQQELEKYGYSLKVWDGFRPTDAQFRLWEVCPNATYVANPNNGFSSHSRGNTVDITLILADGSELLMPTGFDDFSTFADRNYSDCSDEARENALFLEQIMEKYGFQGYYGEWWHFSDTEEYPVDYYFNPALAD